MELHAYQEHGVRWIIDHPSAGLFLEMGLGKTVTTLTAINELTYGRFEVDRVLVIAPLRVAATVWDTEARKWEHLRHLVVQKVLGTKQQRIDALNQDADIYVINRENVAWLEAYYRERKQKWPFDMVVIDELSSFKAASSERFKALRRIRPAVKRLVGLTGTPAPNGLIDLWSQIYLLDRGERLGTTLGGYRQRYFNEGKRNAQVVFNWVPKPGAPEAIYAKLGDICMSMKAEDYLTLPERRDIFVEVELPAYAQKAYEKLERDLVLPLKDTTITAQTAAVVTGKLLQMANGSVYDEDRQDFIIHDRKLAALEDLVEAANGQPLMVYYAFQHDLLRIRERFPQARVLKSSEDVEAWNRGEIPLLLAHPDSAGHGLNLQSGGHLLVWYGLTWSLEKYQQANARLHRQGQGQPVTIYHLVSRGTVDEDVIKVLTGKEKRQDALIAAVKARVDAR